jgi:GAF domain-containing protein
LSSDPPDDAAARAEEALAALQAIALRVEIAGRLIPTGGRAVLRSIVDATVTLFGAEAASLALYDAGADRLVFEVAAGTHGEGVVGVSIATDEGVAGYVFSTGQPIALSDVAADRRFGRATAEQTGYVPRSLIAVPLTDDEGTLGVLEVLDKRSEASFDLHDVELASVFARQATIAIRVSRLERDTASLIRGVLASAAGSTAGDGTGDSDIDAIVAAATRGLHSEDEGALWTVVDTVARLRAADPAQLELVSEILGVLAARAERAADARSRRRAR